MKRRIKVTLEYESDNSFDFVKDDFEQEIGCCTTQFDIIRFEEDAMFAMYQELVEERKKLMIEDRPNVSVPTPYKVRCPLYYSCIKSSEESEEVDK